MDNIQQKLIVDVIFLSVVLSGVFNIVITPDRNNIQEQIINSSSCQPQMSAAAIDWWPMYGHDPANTRSTDVTGPVTNQTFLIKQIIYGMPEGSLNQLPLEKSPVVVDGKLYYVLIPIASEDEESILYCVNPNDGMILWNTSALGGLDWLSPIVSNNNIYIVNDTGINCFSTTEGTHLWFFSFAESVQGSPTAMDNKIYVATYHKIYCISSDGVELWNYSTSSEIPLFMTPAVSDGFVYLTTVPELGGVLSIYCINALSGTLHWVYSVGAFSKTNTPVVMNGKVFIGASDGSSIGTVFCLDAVGNGDGTTHLLWSSTKNIQINGELKSFAVSNGRLYGVGLTNDYSYDMIYCVTTTTGSSLWNYTLFSGAGPLSSPTIADGRLYICDRNTLYCVDAVGNSDGTTEELWHFTPASFYPQNDRLLPPVLANEKTWIGYYHYLRTDEYHSKLYSFFIYGVGGQNLPPIAPTQPIGPTTGYTTQEYTYSLSPVIDPNGDDVQYQFDWDSAGSHDYSDWGVGLQTNHSWSTPGSYVVKARAKDIYGAMSEWSTSIQVTLSDQLIKQLTVQISPSTIVSEDESFQVTVDSNTNLVDQATISFADHTYVTGSNGVVSIVAPSVEKKTLFPLLVSHAGYESTSVTMTVLDTSSSTAGFVYGLISASDDSLVSGAQISIRLSSGEKKEAYSDSEGKYVLSVPAGTYSIEVTNTGYQTRIIPSVEVHEKQATQVNVVLENVAPSQKSTTGQNGVVDYILAKEISSGTIGMQVTVTPHKTPEVTYYTDEELRVVVTSQNTEVLCTITAPAGTSATVMAVYIKKDALPDPVDLRVTMDGQTIQKVIDIKTFFSTQDDLEPNYLLVSTPDGGNYVFIKINHFSQHTISISSAAALLGGLTAVMLYLFCSVIAVMLVAFPRIKKYVRLKTSLRKYR
jgi:hypothetical protein